MTPKRILFGTTAPVNFIMFERIYRRLFADERIDIWFTGMHDSKDKPRNLYKPFKVPPNRVVREKRAKKMEFDMHIAPDYHIVGDINLKVQLFHTTGFRNVSVNEEALKFDKLFLLGDYMRRGFIKYNLLKPDDKRMEMIGMPQVDCLVDNSLDKKAIQRSINIDPRLPTVIFAPTLSTYSSLYSMGDDIFETLGVMPVNFLIKLHDRCYEKRLNPVDWKKKLADLTRRYPNIRLVPGYDCTPYLFISDVVISDASCVAYQFCILDRPVIFADMHKDAFANLWPRTDFQTWGRKAGPLVSNRNQLKEALEDAFTNPSKFSAVRQALAKDVFYKPGTAAQRATEKIYELLQ